MGWWNFTTGVTPNVQIDGTLTVGEDGTGYDVIFYGDTSGAYFHWDADTDKLILTGGSQIYINSQTLQALRAEYNITTQQGAWVHGVKVELTRAANIQPSTGGWFGGQFVLNIGTGYANLDKPAYAVQGIIKGDAASPDGVDIHAGRFETQSSGKVSDIVHILANTGTTVIGSLEYIAAHVAPGVAMLNINAQSSITVPTGIKIMSGAGSSYNYGLDLASATVNTADIRFQGSTTLVDDGTDLTLAGANLALGSNLAVTGTSAFTGAVTLSSTLALGGTVDVGGHLLSNVYTIRSRAGNNVLTILARKAFANQGVALYIQTHNTNDDPTNRITITGGYAEATAACANLIWTGIKLGGALDANSNLINNVTDPSGAQDAATKNYVDTQIGGVNEFTELTDTPANYTSAAGKLVVVNATPNALEFVPITDFLEGTPTEDLATKAPTSEWAFDHENILTTKGDLLAYSTLLARLGIGTDTHVLTADSGEALGMKWAAAAAAGATIATGTYTGNDTVNRAIAHGLGATPKLVLINHDGSGLILSQMEGYNFIKYVFHAASGQLAVNAITDTNFYVGNATNQTYAANQSGISYRWIAIG